MSTPPHPLATSPSYHTLTQEQKQNLHEHYDIFIKLSNQVIPDAQLFSVVHTLVQSIIVFRIQTRDGLVILAGLVTRSLIAVFRVAFEKWVREERWGRVGLRERMRGIESSLPQHPTQTSSLFLSKVCSAHLSYEEIIRTYIQYNTAESFPTQFTLPLYELGYTMWRQVVAESVPAFSRRICYVLTVTRTLSLKEGANVDVIENIMWFYDGELEEKEVRRIVEWGARRESLVLGGGKEEFLRSVYRE